MFYRFMLIFTREIWSKIICQSLVSVKNSEKNIGIPPGGEKKGIRIWQNILHILVSLTEGILEFRNHKAVSQ